VFAVYLIVTILTEAANIFSATCDFIRYDKVSIAMARAGVPESWMTTLGVLKTAGALGLLVGIDVPVIGIAAAVGLIVFFVGAIITHLRGRDYSLGPAMLFLLLAVAEEAERGQSLLLIVRRDEQDRKARRIGERTCFWRSRLASLCIPERFTIKV